jgi:hypothetical protein
VIAPQSLARHKWIRDPFIKYEDSHRNLRR